MEIMRMVLMTALLVASGMLVLTLVARAGRGPALPSTQRRRPRRSWRNLPWSISGFGGRAAWCRPAIAHQ